MERKDIRKSHYISWHKGLHLHEMCRNVPNPSTLNLFAAKPEHHKTVNFVAISSTDILPADYTVLLYR